MNWMQMLVCFPEPDLAAELDSDPEPEPDLHWCCLLLLAKQALLVVKGVEHLEQMK